MRLAVVCTVLQAACCPEDVDDLSAYGERWPEADSLFHLDARWLGGDGAYSIDLGGDRSLWLFGDSFIATTPAFSRSESAVIHNSVAVMTGADPDTATMQFAWRGTLDAPSSFFPDEGDRWLRPADGARAPDGSLIVLFNEQPNAGWRAVRISDISGVPSTWTIDPVITRPVPYAADATIACSMVDKQYLVAVFVDGEQHDGRLARWPVAALAQADLSAPEWWSGKRWVLERELTAPPSIVLPDGSTECSLSSDGWDGYIHVQSQGVGATRLSLRRSFDITGPYNMPQVMLVPPESMAPNALVYGGKGHMHLGEVRRESDEGTYIYDLIVTFTNSSFTFLDLLDERNAHTLFYPHFVRVAFGFPAC
jgi:hypothetical protein